MKIKHYLLLLFLNGTFVLSYGQVWCPPVYGDNSVGKFHITMGGGITRLFGDINDPGTAGSGVYGRLDYTIVRGLDIGGEAQVGTLEAVAAEPFDPRQVDGNYYSLGVTASVYPIDIMLGRSYKRKYSTGERLARSLYVGIGAGYIYNFHRGRNGRDLDNPATYGPSDSEDVLVDPRFKERTSSLLLPIVNAGLTVPFTNDTFRRAGFWSLVMNGQFNFANNDDMDGYVPLNPDGIRYTANKSKDYYGFYSLGIRYSF